MFGWRKPKTTADSFDVVGLETAFNRLLTSVLKEMSQEQRQGVAVGVTFAQRTFNQLYPGGVNAFVNQRAKVQQHFIELIEASAADALKTGGIKIGGRSFGREMATGMRLQNMYFTALLPISHQEWRTDAVYGMVDRLAAQLQPLVEQGRALLGPS